MYEQMKYINKIKNRKAANYATEDRVRVNQGIELVDNRAGVIKKHTQKPMASLQVQKTNKIFPTTQLKAEVKITKDGLDLGREHDLKRYLDISYSTAENGQTEKEMKKQNTYRHMDSQATRRGAMVGMMRYYLEDNPAVKAGQDICYRLQPQIDEWEEEVEGAGGQFLGNSSRNTAISSEYDSLVLELLILGKKPNQKQVVHDLKMNIRNTAYLVISDSRDNIEGLIKNVYSEDDTRLEDWMELLPIFYKSIDESIELTGDKLSNSKKVNIEQLREKCEKTRNILKGSLRDNSLWSIDVFYNAINGVHNAVIDMENDDQREEHDMMDI